MTNDTEQMMTLDRFSLLIEAYGADAGRWPDAERAAAHALLACSAEAQAMIEREHALDVLLDTVQAPQPSAGLQAKIMAAAPRRASAPSHVQTETGLRGVFAGAIGAVMPDMWRPASVFGMAAVLGVVLGLNMMGPLSRAMTTTTTTTTQDDVLAYAFPTYGDSDIAQ